MSALVACGLASCSSELELGSDTVDRAVTFSATASKNSRAAGTDWAAGDCIGIYMKAAGETLAGDYLTGSTANVSYTTADGAGLFVGTSSDLYYPKDGSAVDFIAYYPYSGAVADGIYRVDIADQSVPSRIDLMYANNLQGLDRTSATAALVFSHQLAQVELTLKSADGSSLSGVTATLTDMPTTADFSLADASFSNLANEGDVEMLLDSSSTTLKATAFVIPNASASGDANALSVTLTTAAGKQTVVVLEEDIDLEKGHNYTYTLNLSNAGKEAEEEEEVEYAHWTETPTITAAQLKSENIEYITHSFTDGTKVVRNYACLYDTDLKMAYWVAYPLCNYYTRSNVSRTDAWAYDPALDESKQANLKRGFANGYDRGHQIPSADRLVTMAANEQTFYYTNMTAQTAKMNQQIWAALELQVRSWSSNIDTLYVVTGAMPSAEGSTSITYTTDNNGTRIAVPAYYFKALARIDRETGVAYTIAFKLDNAVYSNTDYMSEALTVAELEEITGFTFFPSIDEAYKRTIDTTKWSSD